MNTCEIMVIALMEILDKDGKLTHCRALLDTCSTANFMTERLANRLSLEKTACIIPVGALDTLKTTSKNIVSTTIHSRFNRFQRKLTFLTVPTISAAVPDQLICRREIKIPKNIQLADPDFHRPSAIDILIGAGPVLGSLCIGQIDLSRNGMDLYLQKTQFGWIIGGSAPTTHTPLRRTCNLSSDLQFDLTNFWNIEESKVTQPFTKNELLCESHFIENVTRQSDGRYTIALPFNEKKTLLGESRTQAEKRLHYLEKKLTRNENLKLEYHKVLQEYLNLGHMTQLNELNLSDVRFYLPHHAVIKETSTTTAVRVVFDGSAKTSTGISLNDTLLTGPTIQSDLFSLLIRFRKHAVVLTGDVEKMYRQFLVRPEDRKFQCILWRNSPTEKIRTYQLNTVTFGLVAAPFLAIRCLHELAKNEEKEFPQAARVLRNDFYVDDALTGASTVQEAQTLRKQLESLLNKGGLKIRKWASNVPAVLHGLPTTSINQQLLLDDSPTLKTLGVKWNATSDAIIYTVKPLESFSRLTKRIVLSEIAKIFDPLGLLAPVITTAKIFMQKLWTLQLNWDESLPANLHTEWTQFEEKLRDLNEIKFARKIILDNAREIQLHGFSDASERAYGACIYIRSITQNGEIHMALVCSKSRVAPVKTITIPRLELCGAVLLTSLMKNTIDALQMHIDKTFYWTDSTIILHWLNMNSQNLKTFVANRVAEIQNATLMSEWKHIRTHDNPADLVSRGLAPDQLIHRLCGLKALPGFVLRNKHGQLL